MSTATVHVNLDNSESHEALVAYLVVHTQIDTPGRRRTLLAHVVARMGIMQVIVSRVQELPVHKIVRGFKPPGEQHVAFGIAIAE